MDNSMVSETSNPVAYTSEIKWLSIQGIIYTFIHNYELVGKNLMKFIHHTSNIQSIQLQCTKVMGIRANLIGEISWNQLARLDLQTNVRVCLSWKCVSQNEPFRVAWRLLWTLLAFLSLSFSPGFFSHYLFPRQGNRNRIAFCFTETLNL